MEAIVGKIYQLLTVYGLKVIAALAIFIIGRWVAKGVRKLVERLMAKGRVDGTLISFTANLAYIGLLAFVIIAALGQLGIQTTSFIAVLGAAGLAVGLALQGSLSNFAAGFLLIIFQPFKVGDLIEGGGVFGVVEAIQIFTTQFKTADNKTVIVPNSKLTSDNIVNWTVKGTRRVDLVFGIGYGDDIDKARSLMADIIAQDNRVLKDPPPQISVSELADSSVNFVVRPWVKVEDYWGVYFDLTEKIKKTFDANGVSIPFPQRDVHVYQHDADAKEKSA
ncbi:mechanosensitive ion channel family protein [Desulfosarcina sp.]|uniref:mechanosensitive ion channel family protein n=1 Tax=Desulfosarcina sp. TaxID=2027861 RepID=UPI0039705EBB